MGLTQPIKWHGGKHYLADWIISHMLPHTHYVESYFGGGSVLLRKDSEGISEVANDLNGDLISFWRSLAGERFHVFQRAVEAVPFSQTEFDLADSPLPFESQLWRGVRFFIRARQSRQGLMRDFATLSRNRTRRGMNEQVSSWLTAVEGLPEIHARMKRVVILNHDALDVIRQQDGSKTLFYLDPPYLHETRTARGAYAHEMSQADHARLLAALTQIKGKFLLSGYQSELYRNVARLSGWKLSEKEIDNKASSNKTKEIKTECLWMNYDPPTKTGGQ